MLELRLLGALDFRDAAGDRLPSVLAQRKRLALLAYLAVEGHPAPRRRDELLALFWPELDEPRARTALNSALYFLRRALGDGVVVSGAGGEVSVSAGRLWCDVPAFERALDGSDPAAAVALYGGDLCPTLFVDTPELEHWADARRLRLRERARTATFALLERAEATGDGDAAAKWARRALALAPDDERALRALVTVLHADGDLPGAMREWELFARAHEELHGRPPSTATRELVARLRDTPPPRLAEYLPAAAPFAPARAEPPLAYDAPATSGAPGTSAPGTAAPARRRWRVGAFGALALAAVATLAVVVRRPAAAGAADRPATLAVFPFTFQGSAASTHVPEALTTLVAGDLEALGGVQVVNTQTLVRALGDAPPGPLHPDSARALAHRLGAELRLHGDVTEAGGRVRVTVTLMRGAERVGAPLTADGETSRLFELAEDVVTRLSESRALPAGAAPAPSGAVTRSSAALQAFVEGDRALGAGRFGEARDAFRRAVAADSAFALAYLRMSQAANWTGDGPLATWASERALRFGTRLGRRDRLRAEAWEASMRGRVLETEQRYRTLLAEDPTDAQSWYHLADLLFHRGPSFGRPPSESRAAWERVLALEPRNAGALLHAARLAARDGDRAAFEGLARRLLLLRPARERVLEVQALRAFGFGGDAARDSVAGALLRGEGGDVTRDLTTSAAVHSSDLAGVPALVARLLEDHRWVPAARSVELLVRARYEVGLGQLGAASRTFDSAAVGAPARAAEHRLVVWTLPFLPTSPATSLARDSAVRALAAPEAAERAEPNRARAFRAYLRGVAAVRAGDLAGAQAWTDSLGRPHPGAYPDGVRHLQRLVRAEAQRAGGRAADALASLGTVTEPPELPLAGLLHLAAAHERWLRGELLAELGRHAEAARWFATFPEPDGFDLMYAAAARLREAELRERLGDRTGAARHFDRALGYWRASDAVLAPLVERARTGLARVAR